MLKICQLRILFIYQFEIRSLHFFIIRLLSCHVLVLDAPVFTIMISSMLFVHEFRPWNFRENAAVLRAHGHIVDNFRDFPRGVSAMVGTHYPCLRAVITGIEHVCHYGHPCSRAVFTGAGPHYPWSRPVNHHDPWTRV